MLAKGDILDGKYRLDQHLGSGGFASVWAATNVKIERRVALKILTDNLAHMPEVVERFVREAKLASQPIHPAIVQVEDINEMADELNRRGRLDVRNGVKIVQVVLEGLAAAHARGIIHRDIKLANIFLVRPGSSSGPPVRILDLGTAKDLFGNEQLTQAGQVMGTTDYVAPEIFLNKKIEVWQPMVDVYAVGMVLFALLTGGLPFEAQSADLPPYVKLLHRIEFFKRIKALYGPRDVDPSIPEPIDAVVRKALAIDPRYRYRDAGEMRDELARAAATLPDINRAPLHDSGPPTEPIENIAEVLRSLNQVSVRMATQGSSPPVPPQPTARAMKPVHNEGFVEEVVTTYLPSSSSPSVGPPRRQYDNFDEGYEASVSIQSEAGGSFEMEGSLHARASAVGSMQMPLPAPTQNGLDEPATTPRGSVAPVVSQSSISGGGVETPMWAASGSDPEGISRLMWLGLIVTVALVVVMMGAISWILLAPNDPIQPLAPPAQIPSPEPLDEPTEAAPEQQGQLEDPSPEPHATDLPLPQPPLAPEVTVRLLGLPPGAEVTFEGDPVEAHLIQGREGSEGELAIRAAGYHPYRQQVVLRTNTVVNVRLTPES
jgi:serine/threonine protein kinase